MVTGQKDVFDTTLSSYIRQTGYYINFIVQFLEKLQL